MDSIINMIINKQKVTLAISIIIPIPRKIGFLNLHKGTAF